MGPVSLPLSCLLLQPRDRKREEKFAWVERTLQKVWRRDPRGLSVDVEDDDDDGGGESIV